jgi:hypothetical protein
VAKHLCAQANLDKAVVSGDALHCNQHQARAVLAAGGDYLLQIKNESRQAWKDALAQSEISPLLPTPNLPTPGTGAWMSSP